MNLKQKLQELAQQREHLWIVLHETNGAMKLLEQQILESEAAPESNQQSNIMEQGQSAKASTSKK